MTMLFGIMLGATRISTGRRTKKYRPRFRGDGAHGTQGSDDPGRGVDRRGATDRDERSIGERGQKS
jgi:hypothetical protein